MALRALAFGVRLRDGGVSTRCSSRWKRATFVELADGSLVAAWIGLSSHVLATTDTLCSDNRVGARLQPPRGSRACVSIRRESSSDALRCSAAAW